MSLFSVVDLGESCGGEGLTCTKRAECSADGVCVCQTGFIKSDGGKRCREQSLSSGEFIIYAGCMPPNQIS